MRRFLRKRWHGVPVGIVSGLLALALVAGGVFAAYQFASFSVDVAVDEPLQVQYNLQYNICDGQGCRVDETGWTDVEGQTVTAFFSAGDAQVLQLRVNNRANSPLMLDVIASGNTGKFDLSALPTGVSIPASTGYDFGNGVDDSVAAEWTSGAIPISIKGDAPPGTYSLTFTFQRS